MQNLTNFDAALQIDYLPTLRKQLRDSNILLAKLEKKTEDFQGKQWRLTLHYARNSGVGAGSETSLPTAGQQAYLNAYGVAKYNRGRIQLSGPVMKASKTDKASVVRSLESEMTMVTADLKKEVNYQLENDGTAVRAVVNGDPGTGTTLTVDGPDTRYLQDGMLIDILNPADGTPRAGSTSLTITRVENSTQVTMSANLNAAVANNDWVTRAGATNQAGTSYELMGIKGIVDDGTYVTTLHNVSRTTYPWWECSTFTNDDNSGTLRDMTLPLIQSAISAVEKNGEQVDLIMSDVDMRDAYAALVVADKRHVNTLKLDGGFMALEYSGGSKPIAWVADPDHQPNTVTFLTSSRLFIMELSDWSWMDEDGSILSRVSGSDAYEAVIFAYQELATDKPRASAFLRDVQ